MRPGARAHPRRRPGREVRPPHRGRGPRGGAVAVLRRRCRGAPARPALPQPARVPRTPSPPRSSRAAGDIVEGATVTDVERDRPRRRDVTTPRAARRPRAAFDAVVLANGAWLGGLARRFGVREPVQAGRGYSFSVAGDQLPPTPVYFPTQRVACTPLVARRPAAAGRRDDGVPLAGRRPRPAAHRRDRRGHPSAGDAVSTSTPPRRVGRLPALHRRRASAHRAHERSRGVRRRRSRHVGHRPRVRSPGSSSPSGSPPAPPLPSCGVRPAALRLLPPQAAGSRVDPTTQRGGRCPAHGCGITTIRNTFRISRSSPVPRRSSHRRTPP